MVNSGRHYASHQSVIEAAILAHMGHEDIAEKHLGPQAAQQARDMRVTSLVDLCRAALQLDGRVAPSGREALIRAAMSTYSLPIALGDAANKVLLTSYLESPASWRTFASIKSANNFKDHTGVRPSHTGDLEEVPPGGELKHGSEIHRQKRRCPRVAHHVWSQGNQGRSVERRLQSEHIRRPEFLSAGVDRRRSGRPWKSLWEVARRAEAGGIQSSRHFHHTEDDNDSTGAEARIDGQHPEANAKPGDAEIDFPTDDQKDTRHQNSARERRDRQHGIQ